MSLNSLRLKAKKRSSFFFSWSASRKKVPDHAEQILHPELIILVLSQFSLDEKRTREDLDCLLSASLVCKSWSPIAQRLLFSHVEPRDFHGLTSLITTLAKDKSKSHKLSQTILSIHTPQLQITSYYVIPKNKWRVRKVKFIRSNAEIKISYNDYEAMMRLFRRLVDMCPNVTNLSFPASTKLMRDVNPLFGMGGGLEGRLKVLTLTHRVFPTNWSQDSEPSLTFPALRKLTLYEIPMYSPSSFLSVTTFPSLETLSLNACFGNSRTLHSLLTGLKETLKNVRFRKLRFQDGNLGEPAASHHHYYPWIASSQHSELMPNVERLYIHCTGSKRPTTFIPLPSMKRLELSYNDHSKFSELRSVSPLTSLTRLSLSFYNSRKPEKGWLIASAIHDFLKSSHTTSPSLEKISLRWCFAQDADILERNMILGFLLSRISKARKIRMELRFYLISDELNPWAKSNAEECSLPVGRWCKRDGVRRVLMALALGKVGWGTR